MSRTLAFTAEALAGARPLSIALSRLVIAGWTGRDPHKVQEHIEELKALGVAPPPSIPSFYACGVELLTTAAEVDCLGSDSSGEAEFAILVDGDGEWWVGVASDHTDRRVEAYSIPVSKQMCPKPVSATLWRFAEVAPHWDRLELHSWVEEEGAMVPYQQGSVAAMLDPRDTAAALARQAPPLGPGDVMLGGTLPVIGGIRPRRVFAMELRDPVLGRAIAHRYTARWLAI
jgi:hypothetical protein